MKPKRWSRTLLPLALIWGWYFAVQSPWEGSVTITQVIGDFKTEAECKAVFNEVKDHIADLGVKAKFKKCTYRQEA